MLIGTPADLCCRPHRHLRRCGFRASYFKVLSSLSWTNKPTRSQSTEYFPFSRSTLCRQAPAQAPPQIATYPFLTPGGAVYSAGDKSEAFADCMEEQFKAHRAVSNPIHMAEVEDFVLIISPPGCPPSFVRNYFVSTICRLNHDHLFYAQVHLCVLIPFPRR